MADVRAFRALHYDPATVEVADVTAPPYDVIDDAGRAELLSRSPYNVVELDLPRTAPLLRGLVTAVHEIGMRVTIEGIETAWSASRSALKTATSTSNVPARAELATRLALPR